MPELERKSHRRRYYTRTSGLVLAAAPVTPSGSQIWLRSNGVTPSTDAADLTSWANSGDVGTTFFPNGTMKVVNPSLGAVAAGKVGAPTGMVSSSAGVQPHALGAFSGSVVFTLPAASAQRSCVIGKGDSGGGGRYEYEIGISATNFPYILLYQSAGATYASITSTRPYSPGQAVCLQWSFTEGVRLDFWVNGGTSEKTTSFSGTMSNTVGISTFGKRGDDVNPCAVNTLLHEYVGYASVKNAAFLSGELAYMANRFSLTGVSDLALG